jgi:toxin secretion/phage lysis holin
MDKSHIIKIEASLLTGLAASFWSLYGAIFICVCVAIIMDFVSGIVAALASGEKISSGVGYRGFWKKVALLLALSFGIFLDAFIPIMLGVITFEIPFTMPIGTIVGCYIVINEAISIIENINQAAPSSLPKWIKKMLEGAGKTIDDGGKEE